MTLKTLTVNELLPVLRVSRLTVYSLLNRGELPGRKCGKHWRVTEAAVKQFLVGEGKKNEQSKPARAAVR
jgi:excisionase family DNA binding protein